MRCLRNALDAEALGLVTLEAMVCAKPVVGANAWGLKDMITYGSNGYFFEPGNANELSNHVNKLLEDDELRRKME